MKTSDLLKRIAELEKRANKLQDENSALRTDAQRMHKVMVMASHDVVFFGGFIYDPDCREFRIPPLLLLCSDTFGYACADGEEFTLDEVDQPFDLWQKYGFDGIVAWVADKRGLTPVTGTQTQLGYKSASADINAARATA